jgi:hypothetical protein
LQRNAGFSAERFAGAMIRYGQELYGQLADNPAYRAAAEATIPAEFRVPGAAEHPLFVQADFGLIVCSQMARSRRGWLKFKAFPHLRIASDAGAAIPGGVRIYPKI